MKVISCSPPLALRSCWHSIISLFLVLWGHSAKGQQSDTLLKVYQPIAGVKIEILATKPKVPCTPNRQEWHISLRPYNLRKLNSKQNFLNFRIPTETCEGYHINRAVSIDLRGIKPDRFDEIVTDSHYSFDAARLLGSVFDLRITAKDMELKDSTVTRILPMPTTIVGMEKAIKGEPLTLQIREPPLREGIYWAWYRDSCGSRTPFLTGDRVAFVPEDTMLLYVRAQDGKYFSPCMQVLITPKDPPPPLLIESMNDSLKNPSNEPRPSKQVKPTMLSYGLGLASFDKLSSNMPPLWAAAEFRLKAQPSLLLGVVGGLSAYWYGERNSSRFYVAFPTIGFRSRLIFTDFIPDYKRRNLQFQGYAGLSLNIVAKLTNIGTRYIEPDYNTHTGMVTGIHLGGNYQISANTSLFAELNSTITPLSIGILVHSKEKTEPQK